MLEIGLIPSCLYLRKNDAPKSKVGYLVWDVDECDYTEHNIENNDYGFYTFTINNEEDVDKNKEEIINL